MQLLYRLACFFALDTFLSDERRRCGSADGTTLLKVHRRALMTCGLNYAAQCTESLYDPNSSHVTVMRRASILAVKISTLVGNKIKRATDSLRRTRAERRS